MKLVNTKCAICGSFQDYEVIYRNNFNEADLNPEVFSARRMPDRIHYQIVRCNKDNSLRSNPVVEGEGIYELYTKSRFTYGEETENLTASYLDVLKPILQKVTVDAKILEIGCGNGFMLKALYDMGYKNIFGVEPSRDAIGKSNTAIREKITEDILRPDTFKPETFDLIYFFQLIEHVADPGELLRICRRLLLPGGFILAFNHDAGSLQARILKEKSPIVDIEHYYLFDKKTMRLLFEKNDFTVTTVSSAKNLVSLKHVFWLTPIPRRLKTILLNFKKGLFALILALKIRIRLGNLCLVAIKGSD